MTDNTTGIATIPNRTTLAAAIAATLATGFTGPASAAAGSSLTIEEIVVTARKREESVQDIPISVTAISGELRQATLRRLEDIQGISPNVIIRNINTVPGGSSISIRGVSYQEIDKSFDPAIGVVMDGVYLGVSSGQLLQNFDMERIEVLRGPQGTLFGKNTIGGVVSVIRTEPTMEWGVDASVTLGDDGREDYKAVVNMPIVEGKLGLKVFGNDLNSDGWIHNTTRDEDVGGDDYQTWGFALLGRPTEDLELKLHYEKNKDRTDVGAWSNFNQPGDLVCVLGALQFLGWTSAQGCETLDTGSDEEHNSMNGHNPNDSDYDTGILTVNWDLGSFLLTSITGYREQTEETLSEYDSSSAEFLALSFEQDYDQTSQELRLSSQFSDELQLVAGVYYWDAHYEQSWLTHDLYSLLDRGGALTGVPGGAGFTANTVGYAAQEQDTKSWAAFASADWHLDDRWTLSAGARYTTEEKDFTGSNSVFYELGGTPPPLTLTDLDDDWQEFSPKIGLSYQAREDVLLFGSYAAGFKSGGFFGRNTDFTTAESYDPEYVDTIELGMKSGWMDNRVLFNMTAFYSEYDDKQEEVLIETAPGVVATNVVNAASAELAGIELELQAKLTERWTLRTAYGYLDGEYDDFLADLDGDTIETDNSFLTMRNAPENTFGISTTYTAPVGPGELSFYASYRYQDEIETILNNDELGHIDGIENLDMTLTYAWNHYRITAYGRNMTDEVYARRVRIEPLVTFGQYTQGENYGVEFALSF